jgi:hypothetical protein
LQQRPLPVDGGEAAASPGSASRWLRAWLTPPRRPLNPDRAQVLDAEYDARTAAFLCDKTLRLLVAWWTMSYV